MADTAVSTPDPDDDDQSIKWEEFQAVLDKRMPGSKLLTRKWPPSGTIDAIEFYKSIYPGFTNGRLGEPGAGHWGVDVRIPPKVDPLEYASYYKKIRHQLRDGRLKLTTFPKRTKDRIKALPSLAKEYLRWRIHDYLIGWVLDLNSEEALPGENAPEDDKFLFLDRY